MRARACAQKMKRKAFSLPLHKLTRTANERGWKDDGRRGSSRRPTATERPCPHPREHSGWPRSVKDETFCQPTNRSHRITSTIPGQPVDRAVEHRGSHCGYLWHFVQRNPTNKAFLRTV